MYSELRVNLNKEVDVVWHDLKFYKFGFKLVADLVNNLLESFVNARMKHASPVLRASHNVIAALINHVPVGFVSVRLITRHVTMIYCLYEETVHLQTTARSESRSHA